MAWRAADNLRWYLRDARLPVMEHISGSTGVGQLSRFLEYHPRRWRKLRTINTIDLKLFSDMIFDWAQESVPCTSLGINDEDNISGERFTVPCEPYFAIPFLPLGRARDIERLFSWIDNFPLETVKRALHLLYPEFKSWKFDHCYEASGQAVFKRLTWSQSSHTVHQGHPLNLFLFAPWEVSMKDIQQFANLQAFAPQSTASTRAARDSVCHALWDKVWDSCVSGNSPWFIVSTYTDWVFGVFSAGWTASFVSPVFHYDSHGPTVLEVLLFWLVSAMNLPGGWVVPEVRIEAAFPTRQLLTATLRDFYDQESAEALVLSIS
ncbi:hypothetical protein F5I97DRAFT_1846643 [Phlebopus sp. FC_14]|nr:hypothetical protein F5I97DRAFT_1846643 [Phlebopus sp. FC_14]